MCADWAPTRVGKPGCVKTPKDSGKSESDVAKDTKIARSRAGKEADGSYVGQTFSDEQFDTGETGAEARSADKSSDDRD